LRIIINTYPEGPKTILTIYIYIKGQNACVVISVEATVPDTIPVRLINRNSTTSHIITEIAHSTASEQTC